jgi:hypothetical protein
MRSSTEIAGGAKDDFRPFLDVPFCLLADAGSGRARPPSSLPDGRPRNPLPAAVRAPKSDYMSLAAVARGLIPTARAVLKTRYTRSEELEKVAARRWIIVVGEVS